MEKRILKEISHLENMKDFKFTKEIKEIIWDTEEEKKRLRSFRTLFPNRNSLNYRNLFIYERPGNLIMSLLELENCKSKEFISKSKKVNLINKIKLK